MPNSEENKCASYKTDLITVLNRFNFLKSYIKCTIFMELANSNSYNFCFVASMRVDDGLIFNI